MAGFPWRQMRSNLAGALALVLIFGTSTPILAQETDVAPGDYGQALAPYGTWVDDGTYGQVWEPTTDQDWQPYVDGSWDWTGDGWTWDSDEPWAWTLHYGRWVLSPTFGWVWVPGDVWGPAWVDWFSGDGFVGWAPLTPLGGVVINNFVFVDEAHFCDANLRHAVLDVNHVPKHVIDDAGARHRRPTVGEIVRVAHSPVRLGNRPPRTIAPWDRHDESERPRSASAGQPAAPRAESAGEPLALGSPAAGYGASPAGVRRVTPLGEPVLRAPTPPPPPRMPAMVAVAPPFALGLPRAFPRPPAGPAFARMPPGRPMRPRATVPAGARLAGRAAHARRL
jgi:hypothetical protein